MDIKSELMTVTDLWWQFQSHIAPPSWLTGSALRQWEGGVLNPIEWACSNKTDEEGAAWLKDMWTRLYKQLIQNGWGDIAVRCAARISIQDIWKEFFRHFDRAFAISLHVDGIISKTQDKYKGMK